MKIYDISQELFGCAVFPGDILPERKVIASIGDDSVCNLTGLTMCAHNGTHVDAPYHFYNDGIAIDKIPLEKFVGKCYVTSFEGAMGADDAEKIIEKAQSADPEAAKRILVSGDMYVTAEAAKVFARERLFLYGNESQTVGPMEAPAQVHYEMLAAEIVLLEGIRLKGIEEGVYLLNAAPINLGGADGAPCRALLMEL